MSDRSIHVELQAGTPFAVYTAENGDVRVHLPRSAVEYALLRAGTSYPGLVGWAQLILDLATIHPESEPLIAAINESFRPAMEGLRGRIDELTKQRDGALEQLREMKVAAERVATGDQCQAVLHGRRCALVLGHQGLHTSISDMTWGPSAAVPKVDIHVRQGWWGPADDQSMFHVFDSWWNGDSMMSRHGIDAALCGWDPSVSTVVLEGLEDPPNERRCALCDARRHEPNTEQPVNVSVTL